MKPNDVSLQEDYQKLLDAIEAIGRQREYDEDEEEDSEEEEDE